jgi:DNA-binding CsgD family transcriptional regulator
MTDDTEFSGLTLSGRELDVVRLVATGLSSKEAALQLAIAPRTVERYLEQARLKTRSRNRTHMVVKAIRAGLISAGDGVLRTLPSIAGNVGIITVADAPAKEA